MRSLLTGVLAAALMFAATAFAAQTEGKIMTVDRDKLTITLENGKSFKLPGEFDVEALQEGMEVILAYEKIGEQNQITDMELLD